MLVFYIDNCVLVKDHHECFVIAIIACTLKITTSVLLYRQLRVIKRSPRVFCYSDKCVKIKIITSVLLYR